MHKFIDMYGFPLAILTILVASLTGICILTAKQNGGKLTQEDARYVWGSLIYIGQCVFMLALLFLITKFTHTELARYIFAREERVLGAFLVLLVIGCFWLFVVSKYLNRWPLYRKMRYIQHWHYNQSKYHMNTPKWAKRDANQGKKNS